MKNALLFLSLVLANTIYAMPLQPIDESHARATAQSFANTKPQLHGRELQLVSSDHIYVYNLGDQGFVIVSGSNVLPPILGYSTQERFPDLEAAPDNFKWWIGHYAEMIDFAEQRQLEPESEVLKQWDEASQGVFPARGSRSVSPLISTYWNQDCYYNEYCPSTGGGGWWGGGPCGHAYAGCVACAMAQVMKYWNYPEQGFGSHSYTHSTYGIQSANFSATTYHWDQMPSSLYSHNDAVATLMYHCGVSVDMNYGPDGSGAYSPDVETALRSYFGYCGAKYREKSKFDQDTWIAMLKADLDQSHPIYYSGSSESAGHAFVCDGYDEYDNFHFNFGWSGSGDNYYSLYNVNGYYNNQAAVFNIVPMDIRPDENGIIYVSADGEGNGSSWENATRHIEYASYLSSGGNTRVWVKQGIYYGDENDFENAFNVSASNRVYGGFSGDETPDFDLSQRDFVNHATILDGQGTKRVLYQEDILNSATHALWDGFTIRNGHAGSGAGVYTNGYLTLQNCVIENNVADAYGGGIYVNTPMSTYDKVVISNCRITENSASLGGGWCDRGNTIMTNCFVTNNTATTKGGGAFIYNGATTDLRGCIIANNTANDGGGLYARGLCQLTNCNIVMNEAVNEYGGTYNEKSNSTYRNCILWGNTAQGEPNQNHGNCSFQYCAVQGGWPGDGNFNIPADNDGDEPGVFVRFKSPAEGTGATYTDADWDILPRSICLNSGKPGNVSFDTDIAGHQRLQHDRIEIGAYELNASLTHIEAAIEENQAYWFNNTFLTEPGYYTASYPTPTCDSVVGLTLSTTLAIDEYNGIEPETVHFIRIFTILGQPIGNIKSEGEIKNMSLKAGCYLLQIHTKEGIRNKKVIVP